MTRHHCAGRADRHWTFGQSQTENILYSQYSTYSACWWLSQWWWMGNCWDSADHALMSPPPWSLISANHRPVSGAIDQSGVSILAHLSTRILSRSQVSSTYQRWNIFLPTSQFSFGVYSSKWYQDCWEMVTLKWNVFVWSANSSSLKMYNHYIISLKDECVIKGFIRRELTDKIGCQRTNQDKV